MARTRYGKVRRNPSPPITNVETEETREPGQSLLECGEEEMETQTDGGGGSRERTESQDKPMKPLGMYFKPRQYTKAIKIGTRCYIAKAVENLRRKLDKTEMGWFLDHPQFRHIFHMPKDKNHKIMGMWMLALRTARIQKKSEAWFVVNGVPIRYSPREHALLSGLYCHNYPLEYKQLGSGEFANRVFKGVKRITYEVVEDKFLAMRPGASGGEDRLKLGVLYFLSSVIIGKSKQGDGASSVEEFFLSAVEDLELCRSFLWGRLSFDDNLKELARVIKTSRGDPKTSCTFPCFAIPLEPLAFEAIPVLNAEYLERVKGAHSECPRMCKSKFKPFELKGFPLSDLNEKLGNTKDIQSILEPTPSEDVFIRRLMDEVENDRDEDDYIVDGWTKCLVEQREAIFFEDMYTEDVRAREENEENQSPIPRERRESRRPRTPTLGDLVNGLAEMKKVMEEGMKSMGDAFGKLQDRMTNLELVVKEELSRGKRHDPTMERDTHVGGTEGENEEVPLDKGTDPTTEDYTAPTEEDPIPMDTAKEGTGGSYTREEAETIVQKPREGMKGSKIPSMAIRVDGRKCKVISGRSPDPRSTRKRRKCSSPNKF